MNPTLCLYPILKALCAAPLFLGINLNYYWKPINEKQQTFLTHYFVKKDELTIFTPEELRSWASNNHRELNEILQKEGFTIQLDPFTSRDEFGVVSVLKVYVEWIEKGKRTEIKVSQNGKDAIFPAVFMDKNYDVYVAKNHPNPIAAIKTKTNDIVYMTIADKPLYDFELQERIDVLSKEMTPTYDYNGIYFPMVDLNQEVNINWLLDQNLYGHPLITSKTYALYGYISQALQQVKFKMNENGAFVENAVAIAVLRGIVKKYLTIDKPFYLWISRPGLSLPILAAYITPEQWSDPKI